MQQIIELQWETAILQKDGIPDTMETFNEKKGL